ncbi:MAG: TIGR00269 family protein [Nanoarchaeota archaeon]
MCKFCKTKPVIELISGRRLCKSCFIKYFEKKVIKTISKYNLIGKNDNIIVGVSSGKDSMIALNILHKLSRERRYFKVSALAIDEGIKGYRNLKNLKKYCKENKIKLSIVSFKDEFGYTLDKLIKKFKFMPCSVCGVFRRYILNKYARKLKADKLATGHNLDDEAQSIVMNYFRDNLETSARLGPITGIIRDKRFVPRIKPLYFLTEKETALYALLKKYPIKFSECPYSLSTFRAHVRNLLNDFESKHPGTKYSIVNSFLEILLLLKEKYKENIGSCKLCKEPTSSEICKVCELKRKIKVT